MRRLLTKLNFWRTSPEVDSEEQAAQRIGRASRILDDMIAIRAAGSKALPADIAPFATFEGVYTAWCVEHKVYDFCVSKCGCGGECTVHVGTDISWARPILPPTYTPLCDCECHKQSPPRLLCDRYCCRVLSPGSKTCLCLCHSEKALGCETYVRCCESSCTVGETDLDPAAIDATTVWPWNTQISVRQYNKIAMSDKMHLHMTVEGQEDAVDLFHILLFEVDNDYPRKPLAKTADTMEVCNACKGIVWPNMLLTPKEIRAIALDVAAFTGEKLEVRIHSWKKASKKKCKTASTRLVPVLAGVA